MPKKVVLVENDIWNVLEKEVKPEFVKAKSFKVTFTLEVKDDKAYKELDDDPLLLQQMVDVATKSYKRLIVSMRTALAQAEKDARLDNSEGNLKRVVKDVDDEFDALMKDAQGDVEKDAAKVVAKWKKTRKESYFDTASFVFTIAGSITSLTFGVISLASTPFTAGVGGIAGIVGIVRGVSALAGFLADHAKSVDTLLLGLLKDVKELAADFKENEKKARAADLVKEALNAVVFPADVLNSSKKLEKQLDVAQEKLRTMEVTCHKLAKEANRGLKACDKGGKEVDRILKEIGGNKDLQVPLNKAAAALDKAQAELMKTLDKIGTGQIKLRNRVDVADELADLLEDISKKRSVVEKTAELLLRLGADLSSSLLSTNFKEAADLAAFTVDSVSLVKDLAEDRLKEVL